MTGVPHQPHENPQGPESAPGIPGAHAEWGFPWRALAIAAVAAALALRACRLLTGLPDFLDEAMPLRVALGMIHPESGRIDWNPHFFNYPSLGIYLHLMVQLIIFSVGHALGIFGTLADYMIAFTVDPTAMVVGARSLGIAADALAIVGVMRIGARMHPAAGVAAGWLLALSPALFLTSNAIYCDSIMSTLAIWAVESMLAWSARGASGPPVRAAVLLGLAAGAKYPALALLLPLLWLCARRRSWEGVRLWGQAAFVAVLVLAATTPGAFAEPATFLRDFGFERGHAAGGHLGSLGRTAAVYHLSGLLSSIGWIGGLALLASMAWGIRDRGRDSLHTLLWLALLAFLVPIAASRIEAERYIVPVASMAAVLAGITAVRLARASGGWGRSVAAVAIGAALVAPQMVSAAHVLRDGMENTQALARRWCETHVPRASLMVLEGYTARLVTDSGVRELKRSRAYEAAGAGARARVLALEPFHAVSIPLAVAGNLTCEVASPGGSRRTVTVFEHAAESNQVFYDPRLYAGVDWIVTSAAVRGRFEADPVRFPAQVAFYHWLDRYAERRARFMPGQGVGGPEIRVYALGARARAALAVMKPLSPWWWAEAVPHETRRRIQEVTGDGAEAPSAAAGPAPWARALVECHGHAVRPFVELLAMEFAALRRHEGALRLARLTLGVHPADEAACILASHSAGGLAMWGEARAVVETAFAAAPALAGDPALRLMHAQALLHLGEDGPARQDLERMVRSLPAQDPIAVRARELLTH